MKLPNVGGVERKSRQLSIYMLDVANGGKEKKTLPKVRKRRCKMATSGDTVVKDFEIDRNRKEEKKGKGEGAGTGSEK